MFRLKISSESKLFGGGPQCPRTTSATLFSTIVVKFSLSNDVVKFVGSSVLEYSSLSDFHSRFTMSGLSVYNYIPIFYLVKFSLSIVDAVKFVSS